jgi:iron complex outermembrane receptor protein
MDSYGVELSISGVPVQTKDWTWVTTPTLSFNRNIITKLSDPSKGFNYKQTTSGGVGENGLMNTNTQILVEGEAVGSFYGYKFLAFDGDRWMYSTPLGGFVASENATENQRMVLGNAQPWFTFGWNNTVRWKNLDFSVFFRGVVGNKILNLTRWAYGPDESQSTNVFMKDAVGKRVTYTNKSNFSSYYLENGSYLKLDNLTVGYTFRFKENKYIDNLRVYLTGQNLFTITSYSGMDPEISTSNIDSPGIDYCDFYPSVATVLLGLNLTLF